jgi:MEMO1 family protein
VTCLPPRPGLSIMNGRPMDSGCDASPCVAWSPLVIERRTPIVAGQFYPASEQECREDVQACLAEAEATNVEAPDAEPGLPAVLVGGIVPHAGWICSGAVAAQVMQALCRQGGIQTFVVFGAAHRLAVTRAALWGPSPWESPLGEIEIDRELASAVGSACPDVEESLRAHELEHSIEVQLPFIQHLAPGAMLMPILVPPTAPGPRIGTMVAEQVRDLGRRVVFVGSTDLTHYGPRYSFTPKGAGESGLTWARQVNDRRMIDLICRLDADAVVPEAKRNQNACGAGAIAATIAACRRAGASRGVLLRHTTSEEVLRDRGGRMGDAVGYAGIVFARDPGRAPEVMG